MPGNKKGPHLEQHRDVLHRAGTYCHKWGQRDVHEPRIVERQFLVMAKLCGTAWFRRNMVRVRQGSFYALKTFNKMTASRFFSAKLG